MAPVQWNADYYYKHSSSQEVAAKDVLASVSFSCDEDVMDVGCGDGKISAYIAEKVCNGSVVGIDASQNMIDFAQKKFPQNAHPNLSFKLKDASAISYQEQFDRVVSFHCLHWIADQHAVLKGIYKSLKPGGKALLVMIAKGDFSQDYQRVIDMFAVHPQDKREYKELLDKVGFSSSTIELLSRVIHHENKQQCLDAIRACPLRGAHKSFAKGNEYDLIYEEIFKALQKSGYIKFYKDGSLDRIVLSLFVQAEKSW